MTTTTLRPNADISATGGWSTASASYTAALSDNSDATLATISAPPNSGTIKVDLTTVAMPAGAVTKTIVARARAFISAGSYGPFFTDITKASNASVGGGGSITVTGAIATYSFAAAAVTLTQTEVDGLRMQAIYGSAPGATFNLYEVYVDLTYALVPTVAVSAPTGVQGSPTPTVTWTYTAGSDGDVQSRYQVRVFTAAQYGIGGFDPAASPATYDSGIVLSSSNTAVSGVLPNSSTLRAYVNVAQTINGTPQWSGYSFSGFTTSFTTSDITSIVGTADNTNGRITLLTTRNGATPAWTQLEIQRTDDGGTTWNYIRGGNLIAVSGATWPNNDYESGNAVSVTYRARATYIAAGPVTVTGAWVSSGAVAWTMAADWLKDTYNTARNRQILFRNQPVLTRPRSQGVNVVIGRTDPVVVSDVRQLTSGQLDLITNTDTQATDLLTLTTTDVLLLQTQSNNRFGSKYIAINSISETAAVPEVGNSQTRFWSIGFTEVVKPIDVGIV